MVTFNEPPIMSYLRTESLLAIQSHNRSLWRRFKLGRSGVRHMLVLPVRSSSNSTIHQVWSSVVLVIVGGIAGMVSEMCVPHQNFHFSVIGSWCQIGCSDSRDFVQSRRPFLHTMSSTALTDLCQQIMQIRM